MLVLFATLCWACTILVLILLPLDVATATAGGLVSPAVWWFVYWITLLVGWLGVEVLSSELAAQELAALPAERRPPQLPNMPPVASHPAAGSPHVDDCSALPGR